MGTRLDSGSQEGAAAGGGALAIWFGTRADTPAEFEDWMSREHLPERMAVPGFQVGRRYRAAAGSGSPAFFTLYDLDSADVLTSPAYVGSAGEPSVWTTRMLPYFEDIVRMGYRVVAGSGEGIGGEILTARVSGEGASERLVFLVEHEVGETGSVIAARLLETEGLPLVGSDPSKEPTPESLLLVDATSPGGIASAATVVERAVAELPGCTAQIHRYDLMHAVTRPRRG